MMYFIGAGVSFDLTQDGLECARKCDSVFMDSYTLPPEKEDVDRISSLVGKNIRLLDRDRLEGDWIVEMALKGTIGLIVGGDPMNATTHISIMESLFRRSVPWKVIHNSSVFSSVPSASGLQAYRFGKSATISRWSEGFEPVSPIETVISNLDANLHTLLLLDINKGVCMDAKEGIETIWKMEDRIGKKAVKSLVVVSRVGRRDQKISFGSPESLYNSVLGKPPFSFVVPSKLHHMEFEALKICSNYSE